MLKKKNFILQTLKIKTFYQRLFATTKKVSNKTAYKKLINRKLHIGQ
jgi:regulatory protein YycH of two-component signal transduction system YycFG